MTTKEEAIDELLGLMGNPNLTDETFDEFKRRIEELKKLEI